LAESLRARISGDVRFDALARTLYATDASIYEILPLGVVLPKSIDDVIATLRECRAHGAALVARGGGTGLSGGAIGPGVQLDCSRHLNRIGSLNIEARSVEVEPGVVLDELNAFLRPHRLHFAPDVATSSRATLGGMIANNSCGARSVYYGRTVDHVAALTAVLADGNVATFAGDDRHAAVLGTRADVIHAAPIEAGLGLIRDKHHDEIQRRYPRILRSNGGYGLDRLGPPGTRADATKILCGSEGTLAVIVGATLNLVPLPVHTGLVVLHYRDLFDAVGATPALLRHCPAAVELIDDMIIRPALSNPLIRARCGFLQGTPTALMVVEFFADDAVQLAARVDELLADGDAVRGAYAAVKEVTPAGQKDVWDLRKAGLGLTMSRPGDAQPVAFVEDSAVDPSRLRDYLKRFADLLDSEGVQAGYYAHASVGCIHVRPVLNLKRADDVARMRRIAEGVSSLALEFGGAMTGEHGDGMVRSTWLEKMYGPDIIHAFKQVKQLFDPDHLLNPGKIVDPYPMNENLRFGEKFEATTVTSLLDFSTHGGMAGLTAMCSGVGQCRQRLVGTMCPSYMATGDETHTTRARANALRVALSNRGLLHGLDDPALEEVMDLCLSCKACKTECPTGVDLARLKAEYLSHRNLSHGVSARARLIADMPHRLRWPARFPRIANRIAQSVLVRGWMERRYGLDRRVPPPRFAHTTFRKWFAGHCRRRGDRAAPRGPVAYFVDTWTNYFQPNVGAATVTLLERAGYSVVCPHTFCCGRPAISQGLLTEAKTLAEFNVQRLRHLAESGIPIVGSEPSCALTFVDEYPQLVRTDEARRLAQNTFTIETFLRRLVDNDPTALPVRGSDRSVSYHGHCHQKAMIGTGDAMALLAHAFADRATEINSGCCGMAGAFGHETEHYDIARAVGDERLFPAVREARNTDTRAIIAVSGFSCRHQIEHHTGIAPRHLVECLAEALEPEAPDRHDTTIPS
jgi:FAD/FMN-containing dehydrogenase/Fe-S oxidoreductase